MSTVVTHAPGTFCWMELGTTDPDAAKTFYGELLGWAFNEVPAGPDATYTMLYSDEQSVGGLYALEAEKQEQGVPPHWNSYIATDDVDASAAKAKELGATVLMDPFEVMEEGRMTVVQDPQGAIFAFWQGKNNPGMGERNTPGTLCWSELATPDADAARAFYTNLFGWQAEQADIGGGPYTTFSRGEQQVGGMLQMTEEWEGIPPHWMPYFGVADCAAAIEKANEMGGSVKHGPMTVEGVGTFAVVQDPQGAVFSIIQMETFARD